ncbi:MAG: GC-type dockerin domain-anchored protein [Phycisphaerales bacterium]
MIAYSRTQAAVLGLIGSLAGSAAAQPLVFQVDSARSSVDITIELMTLAGDRTDSDSSAITGLMYLGADSYTVPGSVVLYDAQFSLIDDLDYNWSFGFAGSAEATLSGAGLFDAVPDAPKGPVPVVGSSFNVPGVAIQVAGIADTSYNILLVGNDTVSQDLSQEPPIPTDLGGEFIVVGDTIEITSSVTFSDTLMVVDGVADAVINGTATIVAVATIPDCPADVASPFGTLNFFDISAYIGLYNSGVPAADYNADGLLNFFDISAFIALYNAGCP